MSLKIPETEEEIDKFLEALKYNWRCHARSEQIPPYDQEWWDVWLYLGGRGTGKTRSGAEFVREGICNQGARMAHLIAPTTSDVRDVMVEGPSGLLSVFPPSQRPLYLKSQRTIKFHNGAKALLFSADEPERLRGPQCDLMWMDEIASWRRPDAYDMAMFGLRLGVNYGVHPRCAVTGTPKPTKIIKDLIRHSQEGDEQDKNVFLSRGSMLRNRDNLSPQFIKAILKKYENTRLGQQEIYAKVLSDNPNALWSLATIEKNRYVGALNELQLRQVIVSVDPSVQGHQESDDTGIIIMGIGIDDIIYILDDRTLAGPPSRWSKEVVAAYDLYDCDYVLYEANQGGKMVEETLRKERPNLPLKDVFATKGKFVRAEPVSLLYEKSRVRHVGVLGSLEDELTEWDPKGKQKSPNRLDALVHGVLKLSNFSKTFIGGGIDVRPTR